MNNADKTNKNKQLMRTTAIGIAGLVWDTIVKQMNLTSLILYFSALGLFGYSFLYKRKK